MTDPRHIWAVVLAAGDGTRLASLTTGQDGQPVPKQFCSLNGGPSLLAEATHRAAMLVPRERICAIVADKHRAYWRQKLWILPAHNVIVQPENRGTAHGVLLPLLRILKQDPDARIVFFPADHHVTDEAALTSTLQQLLSASHSALGSIGLIGIEPDQADPELGYIVPGEFVPGPSGPTVLRRVARFVEKPDQQVARELMAAGSLWNSFIFAADGAALLELMRRLLDRSVATLEDALRRSAASGALARAYRDLPCTDFSRAIVQVAASELTVAAAPPCGWSDLGTPARVAMALRNLDQRSATIPRLFVPGTYP